MLRPTESTIIWMQQLGRGLRISPGKDRLTIIDYIGNHRAFLMKLRAIAALANREAETSGRLRELLDQFVAETISLPPGCEVTYDLTAIDILRQLLKPTGTENALESFYRDFEERHGIRPTAVEVFHAGLNPRSNGERSWLEFVYRMRGLDDAELAVWPNHRDFLASIEKTEAVRSYKIVLLLALLDGDEFLIRCSLDDLTRRISSIATRVHGLQEDFSVRPSERCSRFSRKSELRRVDADHHQSLLPIFLMPGANVGKLAQPVDAGVGPEIDEDHFAPQSRRGQRRRIEPFIRSLERGQFGLTRRSRIEKPVEERNSYSWRGRRLRHARLLHKNRSRGTDSNGQHRGGQEHICFHR
jgi:hypothetical protein